MTLPNAEQLIDNLIEKIQVKLGADSAVVGITSGGAWIVERLKQVAGKPITTGVLDISFYRDDFAERGLKKTNKPSQIDFEVEGRHIILVDDVLHTGRTVRAAMNELFDYGRPASIILAVLVDRGGRELPIGADIKVAELEIPAKQSLQLQRADNGQFSLILKPRK